MKPIGKFLQEHRKSKGLTQKEISDSLGHGTSQYISNIERGICVSSTEALRAYSKLCLIPAKEIEKLVIQQFTNKFRKDWANAR